MTTPTSRVCGRVFAELQRPVEAARFARRSISAAADQSRARREALSQVALARAGLARRLAEVVELCGYLPLVIKVSAAQLRVQLTALFRLCEPVYGLWAPVWTR